MKRIQNLSMIIAKYIYLRFHLAILFSHVQYGAKYEYKTSVLTLNVRGLNNSLKWKKFFLRLENSKADIILLQETFCTEKTDNLFKSTWNGKMFNSCSDSSHNRGVAILFRPNLDIKILNIQYSTDGQSLDKF